MKTARKLTTSSGGATRRGVMVLLALAVIAAACGDGPTEPEGPPGPDPLSVAPTAPRTEAAETPAVGDDHVLPYEEEESGRFGQVFVAPDLGEELLALVESELESLGAEFSAAVNGPFRHSVLEPGFFSDHRDILRCYHYDLLQVIEIQLAEPDPATFLALASTIESAPGFGGMHAFDVDLGTAGIPEFGGSEEDFYHSCDASRIGVVVDRGASEADRDALVAKLFALPSVVGVLLEYDYGPDSEFGDVMVGDFFRPDLSAYPAMQQCDSPDVEWYEALVPGADEAIASEIIAAVEDEPAVAGFSGVYVDESLDPMLAWETEVDWEWCERLTAHVELDIDISDEDAALVVSRALAVPGVADIELHLVEANAPEGCDDGTGHDDEGDSEAMGPIATGGSLSGLDLSYPHLPGVAFSEVIDDCYVPTTSSMTIYRGDPEGAEQRVLADALCDLPGVISIGSFDETLREMDPYLDCMGLNLEVRMEADATDTQRAAVLDTLDGDPLVVFAESFGGYEWDGYQPRVPIVVAGDIDPYVCDPELAYESGNWIGARLFRSDEATITDFAATVAGLPGVLDVSGNAVRRSHDSVEECGTDFIWFWLAPDSTEEERQAAFAMLASRPDVLAVVIIDEGEDSHFHDGEDVVASRWAGVVKFATDEEPSDLDGLIAELSAMTGVVGAEQIHHFEFEEFEDHGDCMEGDVCG